VGPPGTNVPIVAKGKEMKKPAKTQPTAKLTPKQAQKLAQTKQVNRQERQADRSDGHDSRMARDGGTGRRQRS